MPQDSIYPEIGKSSLLVLHDSIQLSLSWLISSATYKLTPYVTMSNSKLAEKRTLDYGHISMEI